MATRKPALIGNGGGLNCTFSYPHKENGKWVTRAYRVRAIGVSHGLVQVASESHARDTRAFYPHRRSQAQFTVTLVLMGRRRTHDHCERERFNTWLRKYMNYLLDQDELAQEQTFPAMTVKIPVRGFHRTGIPLGPISYGEHVGSIVWNQPITFETTKEPGDAKYPYSRFLADGTEKDRNAKFFYPPSQQLSGNQQPGTYDGVYTTAYDSQNNVPDWDSVNNAVNGTGPVVQPTIQVEAAPGGPAGAS